MTTFRPGQLRPIRLEVHHRRLGEVRAVLPLESLIDPRPQQANLFRGELRAFLRHHIVGIDPGDQLDEITPRAVAHHHRSPSVATGQQLLTCLEAKSALGLALAVALGATLLEQRINLLGKTDLVVGSRRQLRLLLFGQLSPDTRGQRQQNTDKHNGNSKNNFHGARKIKARAPPEKENALRLIRQNLENL